MADVVVLGSSVDDAERYAAERRLTGEPVRGISLTRSRVIWEAVE